MVILDGKSLTLDDLKRVARDRELVSISKESQELVNKASLFVEKVVEEGKPVYGINTGFGHLANVIIDKCEVKKLQENLLMSHACGVGSPLAIDEVRAMMVLRINALVQGYSGIRLCTIEKLLEMLNKHVIPVVYEKGSLGASGDLALLSHMSLPIIGLGEVFYEGVKMKTKDAFEKAGIMPIKELQAKEGLSLINGTQAMNAIGGLVLYDSLKLLEYANLSVALTMEALGGVIDAYDPRIHEARGQLGQIAVAKTIKDYLKGSTYITRQNELRVQDAYSIRCTPQVHGAILDSINHVKDIIEREMNAVTDNPLLFVDTNEAISAGNFHGEPLALALDYLAISLSELANISERRIERMVNPNLSNGLPPFLAKHSGLNSGFMIVQYTAASLVSENKVLAHPASVDSIPSSANQEDHVSMGSISARKAKSILENARKVISMELLTGAQALDFRKKAEQGDKTGKAYAFIRSHIPFIQKDEVMFPHLHMIEQILIDDHFYNHVF
ncbi:MAG: histidine ammonia-lyase [Tenericutes bacterium HGW-Tenericutes-3]|nr:MAG: histidine ammonia-lyase [Tenericutes bacterium HGW-Tenericutes-3]